MSKRRWRPQLTQREQVRGYLFFALYFLVFPFAKVGVEEVLDRAFGLFLSEAMSAAVYYIIMAALTVLVFRGFLGNALGIFVDFLPENLLAMASGLAGGLILRWLVGFLYSGAGNPEAESWLQQYAYSPGATILVVAILMPFIEEVLFRGLVFGSLRKYSRAMAWAASVILFMIYRVWTYAVAYGEIKYILQAFRYLPMGLALTWCYDRGGSIWGSIAIHIVLDAVALIMIV